MGLLTQEHWIYGTKGRRKVTALFDTASTYSLIQGRLAHSIAEPTELAEQHWNIRLDPRRHRVILDPKALKLKAVGARHRPADA